MKPVANIPKSTLIYILMVLILAGYVTVRVINLSEAVKKVKTTADTTSYVRISKEPIFDSRFLEASRPFVFPLLLKLFENDSETVVWAQGLFSTLSWSLLAVAVASSLHFSFLRFAGFVLILLLSLYRYIIGWDSVLLTESLSLSLMALFIAGWLWLLRGWHWHKAFFVLTVGFFWTFCRDTNAWVVLMIALFLLALVVLGRIDRKFLILSAAFIVMFFLSNRSADVGGRWIFPFQNVLGRRILPDAQAVTFFSSCGMPVSSDLARLAGEFASGLDRAFYSDPALENYRIWLHQTGKICYIKWLLSDPLESIKRPVSEFNTLMSLQNIQPFLFSRRFSPILPGRLEAVLYPRQQPWIAFWAACGVIVVAAFTRAWMYNKTWWAAILLILLVFPHYFIVWHGDVMGIYRHVVSVSIQFYLGLWTLALLTADWVLSLKIIQENRMGRLLLRGENQLQK
jgi:hypothetical protein